MEPSILDKKNGPFLGPTPDSGSIWVKMGQKIVIFETQKWTHFNPFWIRFDPKIDPSLGSGPHLLGLFGPKFGLHRSLCNLCKWPILVTIVDLPKWAQNWPKWPVPWLRINLGKGPLKLGLNGRFWACTCVEGACAVYIVHVQCSYTYAVRMYLHVYSTCTLHSTCVLYSVLYIQCNVHVLHMCMYIVHCAAHVQCTYSTHYACVVCTVQCTCTVDAFGTVLVRWRRTVDGVWAFKVSSLGPFWRINLGPERSFLGFGVIYGRLSVTEISLWFQYGALFFKKTLS